MTESNKINYVRLPYSETSQEYSPQFFTGISEDFIALCQAQVSLLTHNFQASWVEVYLTENLGENSGNSPNLIPVYSYPPNRHNFPSLSPTKRDYLLLLKDESHFEQESSFSDHLDIEINRHNQVVIPLLYEDIFTGLLLIRRKELPWNEGELSQIEKIARTLAIARFLENSRNWYEEKLENAENFINFTENKFDTLLHQLRNPLTALRTFSKLLLKRILPTDQNQKIVQNILRESDRLQDLLLQFEGKNKEEEKILALNGTSFNSSNFLLPSQSRQIVDLIDVITPLKEAAKVMAEEKNIEFKEDLGKKELAISGNSQGIKEIVSNLMDNALKYTPSGGQIKLEIVEKQGFYGLKIADSGYGIPKEDQDRIFERKYRGKQEQSDIPGTGLGLAIVKDLITQMGGKIELISPNELNGTTLISWFIKNEPPLESGG